MSITTLQVPISKDLKSNATVVAKEYGFSSLQEVVRVFLAKIARRELSFEITSTPVYLSRKTESRYLKMEEDFRGKKNVYGASGLDDLMNQLVA